MPPVNPRVGAVITPQEKRQLEAMAKRLDLPVGWIVRHAVRLVIENPKLIEPK